MDVQAAGYMPKSKSLEHVLKSSPKSEARLIGYDETPIDVIGDENAFEMSKVTESFSNKYISAVSSDSEPSSTSPSITPLSRRLSSPFKDVKRQPNENAADPSFDIECPIPGIL